MMPSRIAFAAPLLPLLLLTLTETGSAQSFPVFLRTPRLTALSVTVPAPGGNVDIQLALTYDARGRLTTLGGSTAGGHTVAVSGRISERRGKWRYRIAVRGDDVRLRARITGTIDSGEAKVRYSGPLGAFAGIVAASVDADAGHDGVLVLRVQVDAAGRLRGSGSILDSFGHDVFSPGELRGTLKNGRLRFSLRAGSRRVVFVGTREGNAFRGRITIHAPPERRRSEIVLDGLLATPGS